MKTLVVTLGLMTAFAACSSNSPEVGTSSSTVTTSRTLANAGEACGGSDPAAALCDETKNLYCQQDPTADPSAPGTCAACADLGATSLVCNDGTIEPGQWVAIDQTCQIVGCGDAQLGEACDDSAPDPSVTCAYPLVCAQSVCGDSPAATHDDAGAPQTDDAAADDAGTDEDAAPTSATQDDAGDDTASDDAGSGDLPQRIRARRLR